MYSSVAIHGGERRVSVRHGGACGLAGGSPRPAGFALVGMGAFLSAASRAPVMAVIMLFEMTLSYDIILPLMLCSVIAYYTARGWMRGHSTVKR